MVGLIDDTSHVVTLHRAENYEAMGGTRNLGGNNATVPTDAGATPSGGSPGVGSSANVWIVTRSGRPGSHSQRVLEAHMSDALGEEASHADQMFRGVNPENSASTCEIHPSPNGDELIPLSEYATHGYGEHPDVSVTTQVVHEALGLPPDVRYLPPDMDVDPRCR